MSFEDEARYNKLLDKAALSSLYPEEEIELRDLSKKRMSELIKEKSPLYEWDYPIKKRE